MKRFAILITISFLAFSIGYYLFGTYQGKTLLYQVVAPSNASDQEQNNYILNCPLSDGFDFPVGKPDAENYYNAQGFGGKRHHLGEDWNGLGGGNSDYGDPVYAVSDGLVVYAENAHLGWGNIVRILHRVQKGNSFHFYESFYGHLKEIKVKTGDNIKRGYPIGTIGTAGGIYLAHLHFEIRDAVFMPIGGGYSKNSKGYIDPSRFILDHRPAKRQLIPNSSVFVKYNYSKIRKKPGIHSKILLSLSKGKELTILKQGRIQRIGKLGTHRWYQVQYKNIKGWTYGANLIKP